MQKPETHSLLFRLACDGLRLSFLLFIAFITACLLLAPFGGIIHAEKILLEALPFFVRLSISSLSLFLIAITYESVR